MNTTSNNSADLLQQPTPTAPQHHRFNTLEEAKAASTVIVRIDDREFKAVVMGDVTHLINWD
jgi:hypothetical protein